MSETLYDRLLKVARLDNDALLGHFLDHVTAHGQELYAAQEAAILELYEGNHVILNTPTGSGKSLVAAALHFQSLAQGRRSVYTCPIKALVNEKWMALCREFGAENVGLSTGDATVNRDAPILCCTAEILSNMALREGETLNVQDVVMDEFHYYSDRDRGQAWQIPLLTLSKARFLLMSATLGSTEFYEDELKRLTGRTAVTVRSMDRPVPLEFEYVQTALAQTLEGLVTEDKVPVYVVHFTQMDAAQSAQDFMSINVCDRDEKAALADALKGFRFNSPQGAELKRWLRHGIGLHHAGLLPKYRILVEQLALKGLLKIICGTDTLGVGINVPIRTVLFTRLCKFDGNKTGILTVRDFHQIAGRAGRKGYDDRGWVLVQAPEHVIENLKLEEKAARGGKKGVKRKPPEHNFVNWDDKTFQRLIGGTPEPLVSRFQVGHGMLLNVLSRSGDGCAAMRELIRRCHESPNQKKQHRRRAWQLFRALLDKQIVQWAASSTDGRHVHVNVDLQDDFSMDQALSLYLVDTLPQLDATSPSYALDLLTIVESILENPDIILRRQLDKIKTQKMGEWKDQGMEYDQRMEELEKLEYPKPLREFVYSTFNAFTEKHPWVGEENIRPKSIAREMFERFRSFVDYIKDYNIQRSEGVLLRHLTAVHKVLAKSVPDSFKTEEVWEVETYLKDMLRQVDSSLLDEWERLRDPNFQPTDSSPDSRPPQVGQPGGELGMDPVAFLAAVRTRMFTFLSAWHSGDDVGAMEILTGTETLSEDSAEEPGPSVVGESTGESASTNDPEKDTEHVEIEWTPSKLASIREAYLQHCSGLRLDPEARNRRHTHILDQRGPLPVRIQQMLLDWDDNNDWAAGFEVDLELSQAKGEPVLKLIQLGRWDRP